MYKSVLRLLGVAFAATPAASCTKPPGDPSRDSCQEAVTTQDMRECWSAEVMRADSLLALQVDSLRARGAPSALVDSAQAAWREYRRLACELDVAESEGGTIQPVFALICWVSESRRRAEELSVLFRGEPR